MTRKISRAVADISLGKQACLYLGNLDAQRDWGHGDSLRAISIYVDVDGINIDPISQLVTT